MTQKYPVWLALLFSAPRTTQTQVLDVLRPLTVIIISLETESTKFIEVGNFLIKQFIKLPIKGDCCKYAELTDFLPKDDSIYFFLSMCLGYSIIYYTFQFINTAMESTHAEIANMNILQKHTEIEQLTYF